MPQQNVTKHELNVCPFDPVYKSYTAPVLYPTTRHFVTEMSHVHISVTKTRVTLYTAGQLAHSPASQIHTAVLIVLAGHGCVNNGCTAVWTIGHGCVQVPGCVEGHPWKRCIVGYWSRGGSEMALLDACIPLHSLPVRARTMGCLFLWVQTHLHMSSSNPI